MTCGYSDIEFLPHTSPSSTIEEAWGYGNALGWIRFDIGEFIKLSSPYSFTTNSEQLGNSAQLLYMIDAVGDVEKDNPDFFVDCYSHQDKVAKLSERLTHITVTSTGTGAHTAILVNDDMLFNAQKGFSTGGGSFNVTEKLSGFVQDNGTIQGVLLSAPSSTATTISGAITLELTYLFNEEEDGTRRTFILDGVKQPHYMRVTNVSKSVLQPIQNNLASVNKGKRNFFYGKSGGTRTIQIDYVLIGMSPENLEEREELLGDYLNKSEPVSLRFSATPNRTWSVLLDGNTDIATSLHVGKGSLTFICYEPSAIGEDVKLDFEVINGSLVTTINNEGTDETYPLLRFNVEEDTEYIQVNGANQSVLLGEQKAVIAPVPFDPIPLRKRFGFLTNEGWVEMTQFPSKMEGQGHMQFAKVEVWNNPVNNEGFARQARYEYGGGGQGKWSGAGIRNVLGTNLTKDWRLELSVSAQGKSPKNSENYGNLVLLNSLGKPFMRLQWGYRGYQKFNVYMCALDPETWEDKIFEGSNIMWHYALENGAKWDDFRGKLILERRGGQFRLTVGQYTRRFFSPLTESATVIGESMLKDVKSTKWWDMTPYANAADFASIGVMFMKFDSRPQTPELSVRRFKVWEYLDQPAEVVTNTNFMAGDEVVLDMHNGQVWQNGTEMPAQLNVSSNFFGLAKGNNPLTIEGFTGDLEISYKNRYV